jgi:hypothetical protein
MHTRVISAYLRKGARVLSVMAVRLFSSRAHNRDVQGGTRAAGRVLFLIITVNNVHTYFMLR